MKMTISKTALAAFTLSLSACTSAPQSRVPASDSIAPLNWTTIRENFKGDAWEVIPTTDLRKYKDLYFMSDIHGRLIAFTNLLYQAKLVDSDKIDSNGNAVGRWTGKKALLILDGDYIDGGESSAQVLTWVESLRKQAGGDIIALLGNHEAELIARPDKVSKETRKSFAPVTDLTPTIDLLHTFKLGVVVGSWFIAHSGYIVPDSGNLEVWLNDMAKAWSGGTAGFQSLSEPNGVGPAGVLERHDWWDKNHDQEKAILNSIGLNGFIGGHEPKLFGSDESQILISKDKWAAKIDTGLKDAKKDSNDIGEILHCAMSDVDKGGDTLLTLDNCSRLTSGGNDKSLKDNK
jgi:hypothetical protein